MVQIVKKPLGFCVMGCVAVLLIHTGALAGAEGPATEEALQPQGLNHAGIYALRRLDCGWLLMPSKDV